jgi:RNA polymerase sigma-70 factor (ECF subfamily)
MADRPDEDHQLVLAVLEGDTESFRTLVTRFERLVAGVAWRHGTRREEIEDVVSDVFLKVYGNLHRYRPEHAFSTWLYRLTLNHLVDLSRRKRRAGGRAEMPDDVADPAPGASDGMLGDERAALVRTALTELDARYREVLTLVYVEGWKVEATARLLGVPEGTVKTRLMRGRDALRKILERRHPGHFEG